MTQSPSKSKELNLSPPIWAACAGNSSQGSASAAQTLLPSAVIKSLH